MAQWFRVLLLLERCLSHGSVLEFKEKKRVLLSIPRAWLIQNLQRENGKWSISIILPLGCCHKLYDIMSNRNITKSSNKTYTYQKTLYKKSNKVAHRQKLIAILLSQSSCTGILDISYHERFFFLRQVSCNSLCKLRLAFNP